MEAQCFSPDHLRQPRSRGQPEPVAQKPKELRLDDLGGPEAGDGFQQFIARRKVLQDFVDAAIGKFPKLKGISKLIGPANGRANESPPRAPRRGAGV